MSGQSLDDQESILLGRLACEKHYELTGQRIGLWEFPCAEAIDYAMQTLREMERDVTDLLNDNA